MRELASGQASVSKISVLMLLFHPLFYHCGEYGIT